MFECTKQKVKYMTLEERTYLAESIMIGLGGTWEELNQGKYNTALTDLWASQEI